MLHGVGEPIAYGATALEAFLKQGRLDNLQDIIYKDR